MGRKYRPVEVCNGEIGIPVIAFVDCGADETIISERLVKKLRVRRYGKFITQAATKDLETGEFRKIVGKLAKVSIKDLWSKKSCIFLMTFLGERNYER